MAQWVQSLSEEELSSTTPAIHLPSSYLDPETNEYWDFSSSGSENFSDGEQGMAGNEDVSPLDLKPSCHRGPCVLNDLSLPLEPDPNLLPEHPHLPPNQMRRVPIVTFVTLSVRPSSSERSHQTRCKRDPDVSLRDEEWGFVNGTIEKRRADHQDTSLPHSTLDGGPGNDIPSDGHGHGHRHDHDQSLNRYSTLELLRLKRGFLL
ncbi:hypothetical protein P171DRAFT_481148 [Karstenula rhodostoma CBS 690.94]|uniref:Uncharacterized protein n=1 Tax=Karstenula rhodostoma CBS 690.94 TaxID=1392251 RepID=A0A9P4PTG0_9PLEO|nr:hypothetical protein P171DRAFT_481148 [Karstenula rhodostoma CBS 690.94]